VHHWGRRSRFLGCLRKLEAESVNVPAKSFAQFIRTCLLWVNLGQEGVLKLPSWSQFVMRLWGWRACLLSILGLVSTAIVETLLILSTGTCLPLWTIGVTIANLRLFQTSSCIFTEELWLGAGFCRVQPLLGLFHCLQYGWGRRCVIGNVRAVHIHVNLTFPGLCVPPHVGPALALALAPHGEVGVADEVHVDGHAGGGGGAVLERLEV